MKTHFHLNAITLLFGMCNARQLQADEIVNEVKSAVEDSINSGMFNGVGPVISVDYLGDSVSDLSPTAAPLVSAGKGDEGLSTAAIIGIAIGAAALLCCCCIMVGYFLRRREVQPNGGEVIPEIENKVVAEPVTEEGKVEEEEDVVVDDAEVSSSSSEEEDANTQIV